MESLKRELYVLVREWKGQQGSRVALLFESRSGEQWELRPSKVPPEFKDESFKLLPVKLLGPETGGIFTGREAQKTFQFVEKPWRHQLVYGKYPMFLLGMMILNAPQRQRIRCFLTLARKGMNEMAFCVFFDGMPNEGHENMVLREMNNEALRFLCKRIKTLNFQDGSTTPEQRTFIDLTESFRRYNCKVESCPEVFEMGYAKKQYMHLSCKGDMPTGAAQCPDDKFGCYIYEVSPDQTVTPVQKGKCENDGKHLLEWWRVYRSQREGVVGVNIQFRKLRLTYAVKTSMSNPVVFVLATNELRNKTWVVISSKKMKSMDNIREHLNTAQKRLADSTVAPRPGGYVHPPPSEGGMSRESNPPSSSTAATRRESPRDMSLNSRLSGAPRRSNSLRRSSQGMSTPQTVGRPESAWGQRRNSMTNQASLGLQGISTNRPRASSGSSSRNKRQRPNV